MSGPSMRLVLAAADFAARAHTTQRRKGAAAEPYVNHVIEVADLLAEAGGADDAVLLCGGLLHDTLEDTPTTWEDLETRFGAPVADLVGEVTDDKSLPWAERKRLQVETVADKSPRARMIKLADKTSNVRSIAHSPPEGWGLDRMHRYLEWSEQVIAGCRGLNSALEAGFDAALTDAWAVLRERAGPISKEEAR